MPNRQRIPCRIARPLLASACALTVAAPALAQEAAVDPQGGSSPYYFGVSQSFSHDSNVYRSPTNEIKETISITGFQAGIDQLIGRQRLHADATAEINRYQTIEALDNKSYSVNAGLDWETVEFLSGRFNYSLRNSLADFGTLDGSTLASDQITQEFLALARIGITSKLSFEAGYNYRSLEYRSEVYANREYNQSAINAGLRWGTPGILVFGIGYRATKGSTPQYQTTPPYENELDRQDIDFTTIWTPTGSSTLNLRLSSSKETQSLATNSDRSGWTGSLGWDYRATGKLNFNLSVVRDTGQETTFLGLTPDGSRPLPVDQSTLSTSFQMQARYAMTAKTSFTGDVRSRKGELTNGDEERVTGGGLNLLYEPTRGLALGCGVIYEDRSAASENSYTVTTSTCYASFTLR
jgi:hypothetical protein